MGSNNNVYTEKEFPEMKKKLEKLNKTCPICKNNNVQSERIAFDKNGNFADRTGLEIGSYNTMRVCNCGHRYFDDSLKFHILNWGKVTWK